MKRILFLILAIVCVQSAYGQAWSGIIDTGRAVNWNNVGVVDSDFNRSVICTTLNSGATATQINNAIAACPAGQVVFLNAGSYTISGGILFQDKSNVTLRGAGATLTTLNFSSPNSCTGQSADVCFRTSDVNWQGGPSHLANWTAGFSKGTTSITLANTTGLAVGRYMILDQLQDGAVDTGDFWVCSELSCSQEGGGSGRPDRPQNQIVKVTGISGTTVTFTPGLYAPNWRIGQTPQAWWPDNTVAGNAIEDMTLNHTNSSNISGVMFFNAHANRYKGVKSVNSGRNHVWFYIGAKNSIVDSYFYGTRNAASQSYGIEAFNSSDNLIQNDIFQHITAPVNANGSCSGCVVAYNYAIDDFYSVSPGWMQASYYLHNSGIDSMLFEGNQGPGFNSDDVHGTRNMITLFRNQLTGWETGKSAQTTAIQLYYVSRYTNIIGNVLGKAGFHQFYQDIPTADTNGDLSIYTMGFFGNQGAGTPFDNLTVNSAFRWGNYDTVTNTVRWVNSEVPTGISPYGNAIPASQTLPASFYLAARPSWWGTMPYPATGPDVTGGQEYGGRNYFNPAQTCYNNTSKTSGILNFSATSCYTGQPAPPPPTQHKPFIMGSLPSGTVGAAYSAKLSVSGDLPPDTWSVIANPPAPGLVMDASTGLITGTPTNPGTTTLTFSLMDSSSGVDGTAFSDPYSTQLVINDVAPPAPVGTPYVIRSIAPITFGGTAGQPISQSVTFEVSDTSPIAAPMSISKDQSWITIVRAATNTGKGNMNTISVNTTGLAGGTYRGNVIVMLPNSNGMTWTNSPMLVPVTLTLSGAPPPSAPSMIQTCGWLTGSGTSRTWRCDIVTKNIASGTAIQTSTSSGTLTDIDNGVRP